MKKIIIVAALLLFPTIALAASVDGYWKDTNHDGIRDTYVQPHQRTNPNSSRLDNYDYPGNYNPNSGSITPRSSSPRETYPSNPNPYENSRGKVKSPFNW
jgi:hypothetical protein